MKLSDHISDRIDELSERGNLLLDEGGDWEGAVEVWKQALALLPPPVTDWEAATWLNASIGEAYYAGGQSEDALAYLFDALNCPDGHMNPFILLRVGQILVDQGRTDEGVEQLLRAYMLDGEDVFEEGGERYLQLLRDRKLID